MAGELVQGYHKNKGPKRITIKVDIAKAFDTLSWDFLFKNLEGLLIPPQYLRWLRACICTTNFTVGYNGTVQGYFKGKRGLRQGDPLSPYLFVIAMNTLSLMLNKAAAEGKFNYHYKCTSSRLTHLCFADDLLIFVDGSLDSVQQVLQVLRDFELRSGLAVSVQKSSFFACGLSAQEIDAIQFSTGMPMRTLPVRYLGVPLCTKKLTSNHCEVLIQQIKGRLSSWSAKTLSFAGRLLLIKTVIAGITTFWCSSFVLPKHCINRINSFCGMFLWKGNIEGHHAARVSWATVTKTKKEGGLGIKDLLTWNKACFLKLIWLLFFQAGSVWVAWFKAEILGGCLSNFWTIKEKQSNSWLANKMIRSRDSIFGWIKLRPQNGESTRFWTDNWSPYGSLRTYLSECRSSRLGIRDNATLSTLYRRGRWNLPSPRSDNQVSLQVHLTTVQLTEEEDYYEWVIDGKVLTAYSIGMVYEQLRGNTTEVPWHQVVWISNSIPKHSFLVWLFNLDRCPTRDRLLSWGLGTDANCLLCNRGLESRNHLFFECDYSWAIWSPLATRCNTQPVRTWAMTITNMQNLPRKKTIRSLTLLSWQATVHWIWTERNARLHRNTFRPFEIVSQLLHRQIRDRILSFRASRPSFSSALMELWHATTSTTQSALN